VLLDSVVGQITASKIPDWDKDRVATAVVKALETWWDEDLNRRVVAVELYGEKPYRYKIDLVLDDSHGLVVVDWKTKNAGKIDDKWELRETRSYQSKLYVAVLARELGHSIYPVRYEIRGVTLEEKPQTRTLKLFIDQTDAAEAVRNLHSVELQRRALAGKKRVPWTRDPQGCQCFGPMYKCEFEPYCWERGGVIPQGQPEKPLSHTAMQEYLRCPERYRLLRILGQLEDEEDRASVGIVFHEVMEALYRARLTG